MTISSIRLASFAKINWLLHILGKRPDGYHEIVTVLQTISLSDELNFNLRSDGQITLSCDDSRIPTDDSNLIVKAAKALARRVDYAPGCDIKLTKRIPAQGGLGGASSNAAATLMGLNFLWLSKLGPDDLSDIGAELGADVPFFFLGGRCLGTGIGTTLSALPDDRKRYLLVVTPNATVATANAYASLNAASLTTFDSNSILSSSLAALESADSGQLPLHNDFERVIFEIEREIKRVRDALLEAGARVALLAGSGSSVFGVFRGKATRDRAVGKLKSEAGWRVFPCETLSRKEYFSTMSAFSRPLFTLS